MAHATLLPLGAVNAAGMLDLRPGEQVAYLEKHSAETIAAYRERSTSS